MAYSKITYGGNVLIDLTQDTVDAAHLLQGYSAHGKDGEVVDGACTFDADTGDATATAGDILSGKTAYKDGAKVTGTMANKGAVSGTIGAKAEQYTIPAGYHNGSGKVSISSAEQAKIIAGNIKAGVQILGVTGEYSGAAITAQTKTVTPQTTQFTVAPDTGYDYLSNVVVNAIPYTERDLATGGKEVLIATLS